MESLELLSLNFYKSILKTNVGKYISFQEFCSKLYDLKLTTRIELNDLHSQFDNYGESAFNYLIQILTDSTIDNFCNNLKENDKKSIKEFANKLKTSKILWKLLIDDVKCLRRKDLCEIRPLLFEEIKPIRLSDVTATIKLITTKDKSTLENCCEWNGNGVDYSNFYGIFDKFNKILIEGGEGIGKTIHVRHLIYCWANDVWEKHTDKLIIRLSLRNLTNQQDIFDAIIQQNFQQISYIDKRLVQLFFHENNSKVLLFLDGIDEINNSYGIDDLTNGTSNRELSTVVNSRKWKINDLINNPNPELSTIVWSRKWKLEEIQESFDIVFELESFNDKELKYFYEKSIIGCSERIQYFLQVLNNQKWFIKDFCRIPLYSLIVYIVWQYNKCEFKENRFEYYTEIMRIIQERDGLDKRNTMPIIHKLHKLAFSHLKTNQSTINIADDHQLKEIIVTLGNILQLDDQNNVQFYHHSFQEFFTAKYIIAQYPINFSGRVKSISKTWKQFEKNMKEFLMAVKRIQFFNTMNFIKQGNIDIFEKIILKFDIIPTLYESKYLVKEHLGKRRYHNYELKLNDTNEGHSSSTILAVLLHRIGSNLTNMTIAINSVSFKSILHILSKHSPNLKDLSLICGERIELFYQSESFLEVFLTLISSTNVERIQWKKHIFNISSHSRNRNETNSTIQRFIEEFEISNDPNCKDVFDIQTANGSVFLKSYQDKSKHFLRIVDRNYMNFLSKLNDTETLILENKIIPYYIYLDFHDMLEERKKREQIKSIIILNTIVRNRDNSTFINYNSHYKSNASNIPNGVIESKHVGKFVLLNSNVNCSNREGKYEFLARTKRKALKLINSSSINDNTGSSNSFETNLVIVEESMKYRNDCRLNLCKKDDLFKRRRMVGNCFHSIKPFKYFMKKNIKELQVININFQYMPTTKLDRDVWKLNSTIEVLDFSYSTFTNQTFYSIFSALKEHCRRIIHINLSNCELTETQGKILSDLLTKLSTIKVINLASNKLLKGSFDKIIPSLKLSDQKIQEINFSDCNLTTDQGELISAILLNCFSLKSLNLSSNRKLKESLYSIIRSIKRSNPRIEYLNFSNCNLQGNHGILLAEVFEYSKSIEKFYLATNPDMKRGQGALLSSLKGCSSLKVLHLSTCNLNAEHGLLLAELFSICPLLEDICLKNNDEIEKGFDDILTSLQQLRCLKKFNFTNCRLNDKHGKLLGDLVKRFNFKLEKVNLNGNISITTGFDNILSSLKESTTLREINLSNCGLNVCQGEILSKIVSNCSHLSKLYLKNNQNIEQNFYSIIKSLRSSNHLKEIDFSGCDLNDKCGLLLAEIFRNCCTLEKVYLKCNHRLESSFDKIISSLKRSSKSLRVIDLSGCGLNERSGSIIAELFKSCCSLEGIHLKYNQDMKASLNKIIQSFQTTLILNEIDLSGCNLNEKQGESLAQVLQINRSLEKLYLRYCKNIGLGFYPIFCSLDTITTLKELELSGCGLNAAHGKLLAKVLRRCSCLERICLKFNKGLCSSFDTIIESLQRLKYLKDVDFSGCELNEYHGKLLVGLLRNCPLLRRIGLDYNKTIKGEIDNILVAMKRSWIIDQIDLSGCGLKAKQGEILEELFINSYSFQRIYLKYNGGVQSGFDRIISSLKLLPYLKDLDLSFCELNKKQGKLLAESFQKCLLLERIYLKNNFGMEESITSIIRSLEKLRNLKELDLSRCKLNEEQGVILGKVFKDCPLLEKVLLNSNMDINAGFNSLIPALELLHNLREIDLGCCRLTIEQGMLLAKVFKDFASLERINLKRNFVDLRTKIDVVISLYYNLSDSVQLEL
ncbi:unnamed protein product [Dimorphilus gyrociliatus]|uniref:NACHT domain-containing protein n=1 Tax=Dimorphilus gyrociliatus TaxID=2664684 RepID=A0A7I8W3N0_9ANNE|nr:unnamed protein product [Dimorphilus gyrociliatus]